MYQILHLLIYNKNTYVQLQYKCISSFTIKIHLFNYNINTSTQLQYKYICSITIEIHLLDYPLTNEVARWYSNATVHLSVRHNPCEHSRINSYVVKIWPGDLDLWPWISIGSHILLRTKYVPNLVKIHWRMLILVFTRMLCNKNFTQWPWPLTLKINSVPNSLKV
jgi:hypothetical protein